MPSPSKKRKKVKVECARALSKKIKYAEMAVANQVSPSKVTPTSPPTNVPSEPKSTKTQTKLTKHMLPQFKSTKTNEFLRIKSTSVLWEMRQMTKDSQPNQKSNVDSIDYIRQIGINLKTNFNFKRSKHVSNTSIPSATHALRKQRKLSVAAGIRQQVSPTDRRLIQ